MSCWTCFVVGTRRAHTLAIVVPLPECLLPGQKLRNTRTPRANCWDPRIWAGAGGGVASWIFGLDLVHFSFFHFSTLRAWIFKDGFEMWYSTQPQCKKENTKVYLFMAQSSCDIEHHFLTLFRWDSRPVHRNMGDRP